MPRVRRKAKAKRKIDVTKLTPSLWKQLLYGPAIYRGTEVDRETLRAAWQFHGPELLEKYVREHPGKRPFGWWVCQHGKERPIVCDWPDKEAAEQVRREHTYYEFLHSEIYGSPAMTPFQEPQRDYLDRHGLLSEEERRALAAADAEEQR